MKLAMSIALLASASAASAQLYRDPSAPVDKRLDDLVGRMTLEEKAAQMQDTAPAIPRLGLPEYDYWNEALHGVARSGEATVFPQAIGMAATWDKDLLHTEGHIIGVEARAKYNEAQRQGNTSRYFGLTFWSPNINIFRDPRWGRGQETLGEDPFLTGSLATQFIDGIQGDDPHYLTAAATAKHYAVHSGPESTRHQVNINPSREDFSETYLPAFRRTVTEGKVQIVMCAYNAVDGKPACANPELLTSTLRNAWGFDGHVTSDCGAIDDITNGHHYTKTNVEGAAVAVKAGTDTGCDFKDEFLDLPKAVKAGLISEREIDTALKRDLRTRFRLGMFDPPESVPFTSIPFSQAHAPEHRVQALRAARESIVLLKNDGILPLAPGKRVAVVGPTAAALIDLEGNYNGTTVGAVLPLDGMINAYGAERVSYAEGSPFVSELPVVVPRTVFGSGVHATYYNGTELSGAPVATALYNQLDLNWNWIVPEPGVNSADFSVRFSGAITPPEPGTYRFSLEQRRCDDDTELERYTLRIDGAEPVSVDAKCSTRDAGAAPTVATVTFADSAPRHFTIDYAHRHKGFGFAPALTLVWQAPDGALQREALRNAQNADVVVAFVGLSAWLEGEEMPVEIPGFAGGDRTDIALPKPQADLIAALKATGKPVVVVLQSGSALALGSANSANAIVESWYGGEQGGRAIADVLTGGYNPGGRLPVTFYQSTDQLPDFTDYSMKNRTYRYFTGQPEYPFGYGLSYTSFAYGTPTIAQSGKDRTVSVTVTNSGSREGDEVVQLYVTPPAEEGLPAKSLKGFQRVHLAAGESQQLSFQLTPRDIAFADPNGVMRTRKGQYQLWVGGGQPGTGAQGAALAFSSDSSAALPK
jgi:beta-glucosidase